jgi:hypothetical protein
MSSPAAGRRFRRLRRIAATRENNRAVLHAVFGDKPRPIVTALQRRNSYATHRKSPQSRNHRSRFISLIFLNRTSAPAHCSFSQNRNHWSRLIFDFQAAPHAENDLFLTV